MGLSAILCRVLLFTSSVFHTPNEVTLEFATPEALPTNSVLLCANDSNVRWGPSSFTPLSLLEGGALFDGIERSVFNASTEGSWEDSDFVFRGRGGSGKSAQLEGLVTGGLADVLSTDPYYATSFVNQRYDDLQRDSQGRSTGDLLGFEYAEGGQGSDAPGPSNCAVLTGAWKQGTRYQLSFNMTNPPGRSQRGPATSFWMAPVDSELVTTRLSTDGSLVARDTAFTVRGNKQGCMCFVREQAQPVLAEFWDACAALSARDPSQVTSSTTAAECVRGLQRDLAANPALSNTFPFDRPPVTTYQLDSFAQAASDCGPRSTLAPRFGGECVSCSPGKRGEDGTSPCQCQPGTTSRLIGPRMCDARSIGPAAAGVEDLPAALCAAYTEHQERWKQRRVSDNVVARVYLKAFAASAAPIIDQAHIRSANATFFDNYVFDDRRSGSPTRRLGIKPSCHTCPGDSGEFTDVYTGNKVRVFDFHFEAMNVFRFIGFLLDEVASSPCPALWDRADPMEWKYTFYKDEICPDLPEFR